MVIGNFIFFYELLLILHKFVGFLGFILFSTGILSNNFLLLFFSFLTVYIQMQLSSCLKFIKIEYLDYIDNYSDLVDT